MSDRENAYAEAIDNLTFTFTRHDADWLDEVTSAVMAVADAEQAELRAEVERLTEMLPESKPRATTDGCLFKTEADGSDPAGKERTYCTLHGLLWPCMSRYRGSSKSAATYHGSES